jgi:hypothetical protein
VLLALTACSTIRQSAMPTNVSLPPTTISVARYGPVKVEAVNNSGISGMFTARDNGDGTTFLEIKLHTRFASGNQAIFTSDFICLAPIGICPTAELLTFEDSLIKFIQLFYDARPFEKIGQAKVVKHSLKLQDASKHRAGRRVNPFVDTGEARESQMSSVCYLIRRSA